MSALLRAFVLVGLIASPALAADKATPAHGGKGAKVSPVCAASKMAWASQSGCDKFKAGICSTVETCPNLCSYLSSAEGCDLVDGQRLASTLANYPTKVELATTLNNYPTKVELATTLNNYVTKVELATTLNNYVTKAAFNAYHTPIFGDITAVVANDNSCVVTVNSGAGVTASCAFSENGHTINISCPAGYYSAQIMCDWPAGSSIYTPATVKERAYCRFPSVVGEPRQYKGYVTCMKTGEI